MKIVWTKQARNRFTDILDYIEKEFGNAARQQFRIKNIKNKGIYRTAEKFPEIGTLEIRRKNLRGFQLSRQTKIFYRVKDDRITILTFFDSRQDPKKRPH